MPKYEGPQIEIFEPRWQDAYKDLLGSPMFLRVRTVGAINLPVAQARADLGTALQADVDDSFKRASVARSIQLLAGALSDAFASLTEDDRQWLTKWIATHTLDIALPADL